VDIDLQKGIIAQPTKPYPLKDVIENAAKLVDTFRKNGMPIAPCACHYGKRDMLKVISDESFFRPEALRPDWFEFVPEITPTSIDIVITKRQWGEFMEPILSFSCGGVGWIRSYYAGLQRTLV
jgi:nicotinamidase-related amidase